MPGSSFSRPGQDVQHDMDTSQGREDLKESVRLSAVQNLGSTLSEYQSVHSRAESRALTRLNLANLSDQIQGRIDPNEVAIATALERDTKIQAEIEAVTNPQLNEYRAVLSEAIAQQVKDNENPLRDMLALITEANLTLDFRLITMTTEAVTREVYKGQTQEAMSGLDATAALAQRNLLTVNAANVHDTVMEHFIGTSMLAANDQLYNLIISGMAEKTQAAGRRPDQPVALTTQDFANLSIGMYNEFVTAQGLDAPAFSFNANDPAARTLFLQLCQRSQNDISGRLQHIAHSQAQVQGRTIAFGEQMAPRIRDLRARVESETRRSIALKREARYIRGVASNTENEAEAARLNGLAATKEAEATGITERTDRVKELIDSFNSASSETQNMINRFDAKNAMVNSLEPEVRVSANSHWLVQKAGSVADTVISAPASLIDMGTNWVSRNRPVSARDMTVAKGLEYGAYGLAGFSVLLNGAMALAPLAQAGYSAATLDFKSVPDHLNRLKDSVPNGMKGAIMPLAIGAGAYAVTHEQETREMLGRAGTSVSAGTEALVDHGGDAASYLSQSWAGDLYRGAADYASRGYNGVAEWFSDENTQNIPDADLPAPIKEFMTTHNITSADMRQHIQCSNDLQRRLSRAGASGVEAGPFSGKNISLDFQEFTKFLALYKTKHDDVTGDPYATPPIITVDELHTAGVIDDAEKARMAGTTEFSLSATDRVLIDRMLVRHRWAHDRNILPN